MRRIWISQIIFLCNPSIKPPSLSNQKILDYLFLLQFNLRTFSTQFHMVLRVTFLDQLFTNIWERTHQLLKKILSLNFNRSYSLTAYKLLNVWAAQLHILPRHWTGNFLIHHQVIDCYTWKQLLKDPPLLPSLRNVTFLIQMLQLSAVTVESQDATIHKKLIFRNSTAHRQQKREETENRTQKNKLHFSIQLHIKRSIQILGSRVTISRFNKET